MALERLAPLGDEGGEPTPKPRRKRASAPTTDAGGWGSAAEAYAGREKRARKVSAPSTQKNWPTREERDQRAQAKALVRAGEIAADPKGYARQVCLMLLEFGPRSRKELQTALAHKGIPGEAAEEVLSRFTEVGLIDDALFASMWVSSRHRGRGLAGRALSQELRRKGIDDEIVREAVAQLDPDQEAATARQLVRRKLASSQGLPTEARVRRLAGMLARKGYTGGLAFRIVKEELEREGAETDDLHLDTDGLSALD